MEGTYPHCLCVRSVLAWIRPLYTGILHTHTHTCVFLVYTRLLIVRGVAAFILVAVSSDGRLFNAIIRRSIVSQPFFHLLLLLLLLHPFDLLSTLGLVRHCFFSAVSIRGVYTSVPTDRYRNEKRSALRGRVEGGKEREFGWPFSLSREAILFPLRNLRGPATD